MDTLCEEDEMRAQTEVTSQDILCDKNEEPQVSDCRCTVNDKLNCTEVKEEVSAKRYTKIVESETIK